MELDIKSKIFYPSHGAGWVVNHKTIEFCGEKKKYFEFQFLNNPITISTPVSNIDSLGIRSTTPSKKVKEALKALAKKKTAKPNTKTYNDFINTIKNLDNQGTVDGFVKIIQYCNYVKKQREKEGRIVPTNIEKYIKTAQEYIITEIAVQDDITYEEGRKIFEKTADVILEQ